MLMNQLNRFEKCKAMLLGAILVLFCSSAWAQVTITGSVVSATDKQPLIGATVLVKGTSIGATTDVKGNYTLKVDNPKEAVLSISYIGYLPEEVNVQGRSVVDIELVEDVKQLEEVVVIGYGTMKKKDLTGSVTSIRGSELASSKSSNVLQVLQGKVSGLDVTQSSGEAGSSVQLLLRGRRSLVAGNDPLILVDGVEYGSKLDINSSDIESMNILKDAASTAIYGTRGANGVIIITTKKGSAGKTRVSYSTYFTVNSATYLPHIMNGAEYMQKQFDIKLADADVAKWNAQGVSYNATTNAVTWNQTTNPDPASVWGTSTLDALVAAAGVTDKYALTTGDPVGLQLARDGVSLDYLKMLMVTSMTQNHELSVSGGNDKTIFNMSLGYMDDNGLLRRDNMKRYNFKFGVDHKLTNTIKIGANMLFTKKDYNKRNSGVFNQALKAGPIGKLYEDDGVTYRTIPDLVFAYNQYSPVLDEVPGAYVNEITNNRIFSTIYGNWDIFPWLTFKTNLGFDVITDKNGRFADAKSVSQVASGRSESSLRTENYFAYTLDNTLNFNKRIGIHDIQAMLGSSTQYSRGQSLMVTTSNQATPVTTYYDQNYASGPTTASTYTPYQMVSVFGRVNYSLMDKYLFQATLRNDNASPLAEGHKGDVFPSASVGWRISEEKFMKGISFISNLKLRYSWGLAGNASSVPAFITLASVSTNTNYYTFGTGVYQQYAPSNIANPLLTWEKTQTHDIGLDFEVWNKRIMGTVDVYRSKSKDLIFNVPLPTNQGGYTQAMKNIAASQNQGIEFTLTTINVKSHNFDWSTDWSLSYNENKVTDLYSGTDLIPHDGDYAWKVGSQINSFYQFTAQGCYSVADLNAELAYVKATQSAGGAIDKLRIPMLANKYFPGDIKIKDRDGNGIFNDNDKVAIDADPRYVFSFNNNFGLKTNIGDFGLSILAIGRLQQNVNYDFYGNVKTATDKTNGSYVQEWTPDNTDAIFPRYYTAGTGVLRSDFMSALKIVKGSFVKIKDITLSYTFPKQWIKKVKLSNVRIYGTAKNMFTFSNIKNYDPESNGSMNFPLSKQWIIGLNLDF